jgi:hypothetical protein
VSLKLNYVFPAVVDVQEEEQVLPHMAREQEVVANMVVAIFPSFRAKSGAERSCLIQKAVP